MTHQVKPAFAHVSGSKTPRIVLVGEAWGQSEDETKRPFVGESGKELFRMLGEAMPEVEPELHTHICALHKFGNAWVKDREQWLQSAGIAMTNVLAFRPPSNKVEDLCGAKKDVGEFAGMFPPLARGKYLHSEYLGELDRLQAEIAGWNPNLVVALGNTACWAILQVTNIGSIRGSITQASVEFSHDRNGPRQNGLVPGTALASHPIHDAGLSEGAEAENSTTQFIRSAKSSARLALKVLPTYHPSAVLRQWAWRPIVCADLIKAHREAQYPEIRRPRRRILISPTLEEMLAWEQQTYTMALPWLSPDIETEAGQITKIGFARSPYESMVIPFWDRGKPGYSYWPDAASERAAWDCTERLLHYNTDKVFQNGIYDVQYLTKYGIRPTRMTEDTMLKHHSLFPEMQKGLGFLGSIYTNEQSWKLLRKRKADSEKKDE